MWFLAAVVTLADEDSIVWFLNGRLAIVHTPLLTLRSV